MPPIQARFMTPPTNNSAISIQQQPKQKAPCRTPLTKAPAVPSRQWNSRNSSGERQCLRHACLSGVH